MQTRLARPGQINRFAAQHAKKTRSQLLPQSHRQSVSVCMFRVKFSTAQMNARTPLCIRQTTNTTLRSSIMKTTFLAIMIKVTFSSSLTTLLQAQVSQLRQRLTGIGHRWSLHSLSQPGESRPPSQLCTLAVSLLTKAPHGTKAAAAHHQHLSLRHNLRHNLRQNLHHSPHHSRQQQQRPGVKAISSCTRSAEARQQCSWLTTARITRATPSRWPTISGQNWLILLVLTKRLLSALSQQQPQRNASTLATATRSA